MKSIDLQFEVKEAILACGADLKGAFAIAQGYKAWLFDGFGDLAELDNFTRYEKSIKANLKKLKIGPEIIAYDMHPGYFSTQFAKDFLQQIPGSEPCEVQHHEAHIASAIVDCGIKGGCIGVSFDGTGYGHDGNIWGGEFFVGDLKNFKRAGHFEYVAMPGGEKAISEPWRMAASFLYKALAKSKSSSSLTSKVGKVKEWQTLKEMIDKNINSPLTSSAGRLFDAVGSIVLSKDRAAFEAELPIELEKLAIELCQDRYDFDVRSEKNILNISFSRTLLEIIKDLKGKVGKATISSKFHNTVAAAILDICGRLRKKYKMNKVVLSGGVFQNKFLTTRATMLLKHSGFDVYTHSRISTNDSGIPIGQIAIARARCV